MGAPFLNPGRAVIDVSAERAMTRPRREGMADRFKPGRGVHLANGSARGRNYVSICGKLRAAVTNSITTQLMPTPGIALRHSA